MAVPFRPMTTKKLKALMNEYLEENRQSPETNPDNEQSTQLKNGNQLIILSQILKTWRQRQLES